MKSSIMRVVILFAALLTISTAEASLPAQTSEFGTGFTLGGKMGLNFSSATNETTSSVLAYGLQGGYFQGGYNRDFKDFVLGAGTYLDWNPTREHRSGNTYGSRAYGFDVMLGMPVREIWMPYARLGFGHSQGVRDLSKVSSNSPVIAFGVEYKFAPHWSSVGEFRMNDFSSSDGLTKVSNKTLAFGLNYYFDMRVLPPEAAPELEPEPEPEPEPAPEPVFVPPPMPEMWKTLLENKVVRIDGVNFDTGSAVLLPTADEKLIDISKFMAEHLEASLSVVGHTDSRGSAQLNKKLSLDRAESVKTFLMAQGVAADRIATKGKGPDEPISDNTTEEGRALNRRVDISSVVKEVKKVRIGEPVPEPVAAPVLEIQPAAPVPVPEIVPAVPASAPAVTPVPEAVPVPETKAVTVPKIEVPVPKIEVPVPKIVVPVPKIVVPVPKIVVPVPKIVVPVPKVEVSAPKSVPVTKPVAVPEPVVATQQASLGGTPIRIDGSSFAPGSAKLKPAALKQLDDVAKAATNDPESNLLVSGYYVDERSTEQVALSLSTARAESVKEYLVKGGVAAARITAVGKGFADPIGDSKTDAGRAQNRRVEIRSVSKGGATSAPSVPVRAATPAPVVAPATAPVAAPVPAAAPAPAPVKVVPEDKKVRIDGSNFAPGTAKIKPAAYEMLDEVAKSAANNPQAKLMVSGYYVDENSTELTAGRLSAARAASVKDYLVSKGVAAKRISAVGKGMADPVGDNKTDVGRAQNRRVEILLQN